MLIGIILKYIAKPKMKLILLQQPNVIIQDIQNGSLEEWIESSLHQ